MKKDKYLASRRVQALLGNAEKAASLVVQQVEYVKIESGTTWVGLTMPPPPNPPSSSLSTLVISGTPHLQHFGRAPMKKSSQQCFGK